MEPRATPDWHAVHAHERRRRVPLPTYPFERQRYFVEPMQGAPLSPTVAATRKPPSDWFYCPIWKQSPPIPAIDGPVRRVCSLRGPAGPLRAPSDPAASDRTHRGPGQARGAVCHLGTDEFSLRADACEDHVALLQALTEASFRPEVFVHGFLLPAIPGGRVVVGRALGLYSLLALTQAADQYGLLAGVRIAVLTTGLCSVGGYEEMEPEKATLLGWLKTVPHGTRTPAPR